MEQLHTETYPAQLVVHPLTSNEEVQETISEDTAKTSSDDSGLAVLHEDVHRRAQSHQRLLSVTVFSTIILSLVITFGLYTLIRYFGESEEFWNGAFPVLVITIMASLLGAVASMVLKAGKENRRVRRQMDILARSKNVESVGVLIDLFHFDDLTIHRRARRKLTELLPKLRADQAHLLTREQRLRLNHFLAVSWDPLGHKDIREFFEPTAERDAEFRVAILKAYEQVGDKEALPIVERLANGPTRTGVEASVQAAAKECLPYLKLRIQQQTAQNSLLRASAPTAVSAETLLRPAASKPVIPAVELLRPLGCTSDL